MWIPLYEYRVDTSGILGTLVKFFKRWLLLIAGIIMQTLSENILR